jgi:hypothetical protein
MTNEDFICKARELANRSEEAYRLRRNFAKFLAPMYVEDHRRIANLCDDELDQTGNLLGYVRDEAMKLKQPVQ